MAAESWASRHWGTTSATPSCARTRPSNASAGTAPGAATTFPTRPASTRRPASHRIPDDWRFVVIKRVLSLIPPSTGFPQRLGLGAVLHASPESIMRDATVFLDLPA